MKSVQIRIFFWSVFSSTWTQSEIYSVNLRIHSKYRKIRTRKNSVFGHFSRSVCFSYGKINLCWYIKTSHNSLIVKNNVIFSFFFLSQTSQSLANKIKLKKSILLAYKIPSMQNLHLNKNYNIGCFERFGY